MQRRSSRFRSWCAGLHGGQLVMLLLAISVVAAISIFVGFASILENTTTRHSLARATNYASYSANREDTLPDRDLWELKVDHGFSADEALVYTALRPRGSTSPRLGDPTDLASRIVRHLQKHPGDTQARSDLRYVTSQMRGPQFANSDSAMGLIVVWRGEVHRAVGLTAASLLFGVLALALAWLALWSWLGARSTKAQPGAA
jgi:hypothetical protein